MNQKPERVYLALAALVCAIAGFLCWLGDEPRAASLTYSLYLCYSMVWVIADNRWEETVP